LLLETGIRRHLRGGRDHHYAGARRAPERWLAGGQLRLAEQARSRVRPSVAEAANLLGARVPSC
jgi:hypothetical protein